MPYALLYNNEVFNDIKDLMFCKKEAFADNKRKNSTQFTSVEGLPA
jgi:hypothetical protein